MGLLSQFDQNNVSPAALQALAALESAAGRGFGINSAYRDAGHNAAVGGANQSQHIQGNAFDIDVSGLSEAERITLIEQARAAGFGGVGVYNNALHFDVAGTRNWGPDFHAGSTPEWALPALGGATSRPTNAVTSTGGVGQPDNALAPSSAPSPQMPNVLAQAPQMPAFQMQDMRQDPANFMSRRRFGNNNALG